MGASGLVAGPWTTEPSVMLNLLPWQGQLMVPPETLATMQPWCVHTAVNALNEPDCGWVITMFLPLMILPPPEGMSDVLARALAGGAAVVAAPPPEADGAAPPPEADAAAPPPDAEGAAPVVAPPPVAGGGPVRPPLLTSYVAQPVSTATPVTQAHASSARRLCGS